MKLSKKLYHRIYYLKNREHLLDYSRAYYKENIERCRANNKLWKQNNIPGYKKPPPLKKHNEKVIIYFD